MKLLSTLAASAALSAVMAGAAFAQAPTQTFTLTGTVASTCVLSAFNGTTNLGQFSINTTAGDANLFKVITPISVAGPSAAAGCNHGVTVGLTKSAQGLTTPQTTGFDAAVFQNNIPYKVTAIWNGAQANGSTTVTNTLADDVNQQVNGVQAGAFISAIQTVIDVPVTSKAVLAGTYTDTVGVQLAVF
jgi:hypothetical protein